MPLTSQYVPKQSDKIVESLSGEESSLLPFSDEKGSPVSAGQADKLIIYT